MTAQRRNSKYMTGGTTSNFYYNDQVRRRGATPENPALSCGEVEDFRPLGDERHGLAWIRLSLQEVRQIYCDNSFKGGGWAYVVNIRSYSQDHSDVKEVAAGARENSEGFP